eukprot:3176006-Rhodomonas_salina.2
MQQALRVLTAKTCVKGDVAQPHPAIPSALIREFQPLAVAALCGRTTELLNKAELVMEVFEPVRRLVFSCTSQYQVMEMDVASLVRSGKG